VATSSFYHNVIIDDDEKARRLTKALDASEKWNEGHRNRLNQPPSGVIVEEEAAIKRIAKSLGV